MSEPLFQSTSFPIAGFELVGGGVPVVTRDVTLTNLGGTGPLVRGTVLGMVTASGKYGISLVAGVDGSQIPRAVLAHDADPTGGDVAASIYEAGEFNQRAMTFGTGHDADTVREPLREVSIFVRDSVARGA